MKILTLLLALTTTKIFAYSQEYRSQKNFNLVAQMGLLDNFGWGTGHRLGFYANPQLLWEWSFFESEFSILGQSVQTQNNALILRQFLGNSFNLTGGLGLSKKTYRDRFWLSDSIYHAEYTHLRVEMGLGNSWHSDTFNIGCDWFGLYVPVTKLSHRDKSTVTGTSYDDARRDSDRSVFRPSVFITRFFVGVGF